MISDVIRYVIRRDVSEFAVVVVPIVLHAPTGECGFCDAQRRTSIQGDVMHEPQVVAAEIFTVVGLKRGPVERARYNIQMNLHV